MTDIVQWLRGVEPSIQGPLFGGPVCVEAADEIESLRKLLREARAEVEWWSPDEYTADDHEIVRLADWYRLRDRIDAFLSREEA